MRQLSTIGLNFVALAVLSGPARAQEMSCPQLLVQCGDGPSQMLTENHTMSFVGGGQISTQCVGIMSGVLASYQNCHGELNWVGAAAILIHFVHANPKLMKQTGWDCAQAAFTNVFACKTQ
jgi:hypothetical protein